MFHNRWLHRNNRAILFRQGSCRNSDDSSRVNRFRDGALPRMPNACVGVTARLARRRHRRIGATRGDGRRTHVPPRANARAVPRAVYSHPSLRNPVGAVGLPPGLSSATLWALRCRWPSSRCWPFSSAPPRRSQTAPFPGSQEEDIPALWCTLVRSLQPHPHL